MKEQLPATASEIVVKGTQTHQHKFNNINFSDFEATSDPFADLELKSINDLAELQTILGRVSTANTSTSQPPHTGQVYTAGKVIIRLCTMFTVHHTNVHNVDGLYFSAASSSVYPGPRQQQQAAYMSSLPPSQALASRLAQPSQQQPGYSNYGYSYQLQQPGTQQFYPPTTSSQAPGQYYPHPYNYQPAPFPGSYSQQPATSQSQPQAFTVHNPGTAASLAAEAGCGGRSVSSDRDRAQPQQTKERLKDGEDAAAAAAASAGSGELKRVKSVGDMITELQKEAAELADHKRKSPGSRPTSRGATGLENWTPWPQLDQDQPRVNGHAAAASADDGCLASLGAEDARLCRQLHEMGFPLSRLAKGVAAVGADSQKLINFCLVVDR